MVALACALGIVLTRESGRIAAIWLANGLLAGVLLSVATSRWTAFVSAGWVGNVLANLASGDGVLLAGTLSLCNSIEVLIVAGGMRAAAGERIDLTTWPALRALLVYGIAAGPLASAILAAAFLAWHGTASFTDVLRVWYPSDALRIGIITPLLLEIRQEGCSVRGIGYRDSWLAPLLLTAVTLAVFSQTLASVAFLILPPLMFLVFRRGYAGAAGGIALVTVISIPLTLLGRGPFSLVPDVTMQERILLLQLFIAARWRSVWRWCSGSANDSSRACSRPSAACAP